MSGICGWLGHQLPDIEAEQLIQSMASALQNDHTQTKQHLALGNAAMAGASVSQNIHIQRYGEQTAFVYGNDFSAPDIDLAAIFLEHYPREGIKALLRLNGPFALAYINKESNEVILAVDRMAVYPMSYTVSNKQLIFGSTANAICKHPQANVSLDPQAIFNYIYFHVIPSPGTIYKEVKRLLPGSYVHFKDGELQSEYYWQPNFTELKPANKSELSEEFNDILRRSTKAAASNTQAGCFLSGGTDSSSVTGYAQQGTDYNIPSYSIGFEAEGFDESYYARIAAERFKTDHHEYYLKPEEITESIPLVAAHYDQPFGNSSAVPAFGCAKLAKSCGTARMLAGDGGDELFGGNQRYAKQLIFAHYDRIPAAIRKPLIDPLADLLPGSKWLMPLRKIKRYIEQAQMPMPDRMEGHNLLLYFGAEKIFSSDLLGNINQDNPRQLLREMYNTVQANNILNNMLGLDFKITLSDNDLPKVTEMCDLAGVEVAFPMLSNELVDFSAKLPMDYKLKGGKLRPFFKEALNQHLPIEIINKKKHGFGLPFGVWALNNAGLKEIVFDSLNSLKARKLVNADFIDTLANKHLPEHPNYFGVMVWILVMLEQWFQQHKHSL